MEEHLSAALGWRPLAASDLPLLAEWLRGAQVARWWNHESSAEAVERDFGPSVRGEEAGEDLIVSVGGRPIGLVQRSLLRDYPDDLAEFVALVDVPDGAVELDYLIGDRALRGRGLGAKMIGEAIEKTWTDHPSVTAVLVAVVAANVASWRTLEKAGMRPGRRRLLVIMTPSSTRVHLGFRNRVPLPARLRNTISDQMDVPSPSTEHEYPVAADLTDHCVSSALRSVLAAPESHRRRLPIWGESRVRP